MRRNSVFGSFSKQLSLRRDVRVHLHRYLTTTAIVSFAKLQRSILKLMSISTFGRIWMA